MGDDQTATACSVCGAFVTRDEQIAYVVEEMDRRLMSLSELATALEHVRAPVPFRTLQSWARRGSLRETEPGLYRFRPVFERAAKKATRVVVEGSAA